MTIFSTIQVRVAFLVFFATISSGAAVRAHDEAAQEVDPQPFLRKRLAENIARHPQRTVNDEKRQPKEQEDELEAEFTESLLRRYLDGESSMLPSNNNEGNKNERPVFTDKQPAWPHEKSDIALDPDVVLGELENGMRYQLRQNSAPANRLEMRLHVDAGANMEQDDELGLAHFLEHLAFRTLRNFPEGSMTKIFQRLGLGAGSHVNAYTNFHETVYKLGLPNTEDETVTTAFTWFRDVCDGILFLQDEIDVERGVVLSELQDKDSVGERIWEQTLEWLIPDHLRSDRDTIGTEETISSVTREQFVNFYQTYYVPRRVIFTLVGDMDVSDMEGLVQQYFGSWEDSGDRGFDQSYGSVPSDLGFRSNVLLDSEIAFDRLTIDGARPYDSSLADTEERRIERMKLSIANGIIARRLQTLADEPEATITWGSAGISRWYTSIEFPYIWVQPKKGLWRESVQVLEQEFRRALLHGFTDAELAFSKANRINFFEQQVLAKDTRSSSQLVGGLVSSINGDFLVSTPEDDLRIVSLGLQYLTVDELERTFSTYWNTTNINLYLTTSTLENASTEEGAIELEELYFASQLVKVEPPQDQEPVLFAYTDFGPAGTIVSDTMVEDLEIRQLILSNNIRVNLKTTNNADENIQVLARFGTGKLGQPTDPAFSFLDDFTEYLMERGGLGKQSSVELRSALAGKNVGLNVNTNFGAFTISATTNPDDLQLQLQFIAAHFVDPGFGDEAVRSWRSKSPSYLANLQYTLQNTFDYETKGWLMGNDERFTKPTLDELLSMEASDAKEWIIPQLDKSYLEISLVGDLDQTTAIKYLLETFGAMPERDDEPAEIAPGQREISVPEPQEFEITYETKVPNAATMAVWQLPSRVLDGNTTDIATVAVDNMLESRKLIVLQSVFQDRMKNYIRETLGGSYAPRAWTIQSDDFDYGLFYAYSEGEPEEMVLLNNAIMAIAKNLTSAGEAGAITEDELVRAILPRKTRVQESRGQNGYWLYQVLAQSQEQPYRLDLERTRDAHYDAITVDDLNQLAKQYLAEELALQVSIMPVNATSNSNGLSTAGSK